LVQLAANVYIYELWRASAHNFPDKNWLWEIRRIFQVRTDQAIAFTLLCFRTLFSVLFVALAKTYSFAIFGF
tara:strand:+ start:941 stop:1156 length:216 start_codon:yes stop_codon:yes gene_type:complete